MLIYVESAYVDQVALSLRLSERGDSASAIQIPTIRDREFTSGTLDILGVPVDPRFRTTLRIYGVDPSLVGDVRVRMLSDPQNELISETTYSLTIHPVTYTPQYGSQSFDIRPPAVEINYITDPVKSATAVRFEIVPVAMGLRIWAFASVTDRVSQRVLLRTPR